MQQVQAAVEDALPSGPFDPGDLLVTRVYDKHGIFNKSLASASRGFTVKSLTCLEYKHTLFCRFFPI